MAELLYGRKAKSLIVQEARVATSRQTVTMLNLPYTIVVRFDDHSIDVVILTPETADAFGI